MTDGPPDNAAVISLVVGRLGVGAVCAADATGAVREGPAGTPASTSTKLAA